MVEDEAEEVARSTFARRAWNFASSGDVDGGRKPPVAWAGSAYIPYSDRCLL